MALALGALAGCAVPPPLPCAAPPVGDVAWVVDHGWHTDIALRAADLDAPLRQFLPLFPGAQALAFGFGKRSFVLAEAGAVEELLLGPIPGRGVIQVKGIAASPGEAYGDRAIGLGLPEGGLAALTAFINASIAADPAPLALRGSLFLEAARGYSLLYTCNTWTAQALRVSGLPVSEEAVVLARAVLGQARAIGCIA
jgi:hypothetical protein